MITIRTPLRITLGGGGTDLPAYYSKYGGFIFSLCIDQYVYINVKTNDLDPRVKLRLMHDEELALLDNIRHDLTREALRMLNFQNGIEIETSADIPAGTGLGSSSSYAVGLLKALHALKGEPASPLQLAEEDFKMETEILGKPIGKQDPYTAALGGFTVLDIDKDGTVRVSKAKIAGETLETLNRNLLLFYTGITRHADDILHSQSQAVTNGSVEIAESMHRIKSLGYRILSAVENGRTSEIGPIFNEHWQHKKNT